MKYRSRDILNVRTHGRSFFDLSTFGEAVCCLDHKQAPNIVLIMNCGHHADLIIIMSIIFVHMYISINLPIFQMSKVHGTAATSRHAPTATNGAL